MLKPAVSRFLLLFLVCLVFSLAVSYAAYRLREHADAYPKSVTWVTPFDAFEPMVSADVETGTSEEGVFIGYGAILGNAVLWTLMLKAIAYGAGKVRAGLPLKNTKGL